MATLLNAEICGASYHVRKPGTGWVWQRAENGRAL